MGSEEILIRLFAACIYVCIWCAFILVSMYVVVVVREVGVLNVVVLRLAGLLVVVRVCVLVVTLVLTVTKI